jgi:acyl carrier protein
MSQHDFLTFARCLGAAIRVDIEGIGPETLIEDDLEIDSLQMIEVVLTMDDLGAALSEEAATTIVTVGDLYDYYLSKTSNGESNG